MATTKDRKSAPRRRKTTTKKKPARNPGRTHGRIPDLLKDPTLVSQICRAIEMGCSDKDACTAVGMSKETFYKYIRWGAEPDRHEAFKQFADRVRRARAIGSQVLVNTIHTVARGQAIFDDDGKVIGYRGGEWKAAAHLLALRDPEAYSIRHKLEHSGSGGGPLGVQIYLPEEEDEP